MQNTLVLIIAGLILLLLISTLSVSLLSDLKRLCYAIVKPFFKTKHFNKSDYNKAFNYLLKRKSITNAELKEERIFFLSLINHATTLKQLQEFTKQIKKFYKKKVNFISSKKIKAQQDIYTQQCKEIVIFLIMAIRNRFEIINQFDTLDDYRAFAELILTADEITTIDAIIMFAEKLKPSDYKKLQRLAMHKKCMLEPHNKAYTPSTAGLSVFKLIKHIITSTVKYLTLGYSLLVFVSLFVSLLVPNMVTSPNDKLLQLANTLKVKPFIPHFATLNTGYYVINNRVYFYKQPSFFQEQQRYYLAKLTEKLCKTTTFSKVCYRNR